jgi:hypothetical protein
MIRHSGRSEAKTRNPWNQNLDSGIRRNGEDDEEQ